MMCDENDSLTSYYYYFFQYLLSGHHIVFLIEKLCLTWTASVFHCFSFETLDVVFSTKTDHMVVKSPLALSFSVIMHLYHPAPSPIRICLAPSIRSHIVNRLSWPSSSGNNAASAMIDSYCSALDHTLQFAALCYKFILISSVQQFLFKKFNLSFVLLKFHQGCELSGNGLNLKLPPRSCTHIHTLMWP